MAELAMCVMYTAQIVFMYVVNVKALFGASAWITSEQQTDIKCQQKPTAKRLGRKQGVYLHTVEENTPRDGRIAQRLWNENKSQSDNDEQRCVMLQNADDRHQWGESAEATTTAEISWTMMTRPDLT